jgi:superfamily II DNA/RNA helicase
MIFINRVADIEEAAEKLLYHHYPVDYIHGTRTKEERKKAIQSFRSGKIRYLIATDIAARGLDFDHIDTVFHVSIPEDAEDYLHRAGRTGRNGASGRNILIVSSRELPLLRRLEKELGIRMEEKFYYKGKLQGQPPVESRKG